MLQNKEKVVVCGHYGSTNIGDEAIGLSLIQRIQGENPESEITFLSYKPSNTKEVLKVDSVYLLPLGIKSLLRGIFKGELFKTLSTIKNCDKFIIGGGGLFTDEKLLAVFLWGLHAFCAYRYAKPVYMIGQSVGPLNTRIGKWITKKCFEKAKKIVVRDSSSKEILEKIGINKEIMIEKDLVFSLKMEGEFNNDYLNKKVEQNNLKGYFIVNLRPWPKNTEILYKKINQLLHAIVEKYSLLPLFIPFQECHQNDAQLMHNILEQNPQKYPILIQKFDHNIFRVISCFKDAEFTLGMRLHSLIFSMIQNTPIIALSYSPKISNMLKDNNLNNFIIDLDKPEMVLEAVDAIMNTNKNHEK